MVKNDIVSACSVNLGNIQLKQFLVGDDVILYHRTSTRIRRNVFNRLGGAVS